MNPETHNEIHFNSLLRERHVRKPELEQGAGAREGGGREGERERGRKTEEGKERDRGRVIEKRRWERGTETESMERARPAFKGCLSHAHRVLRSCSYVV